MGADGSRSRSQVRVAACRRAPTYIRVLADADGPAPFDFALSPTFSSPLCAYGIVPHRDCLGLEQHRHGRPQGLAASVCALGGLGERCCRQMTNVPVHLGIKKAARRSRASAHAHGPLGVTLRAPTPGDYAARRFVEVGICTLLCRASCSHPAMFVCLSEYRCY